MPASARLRGPCRETAAGGAFAAVANCTQAENRRSLPPVLAMVSVRVVCSPVNKSAVSESGVTAMSGGTRPVPDSDSASVGWSGSLLRMVRVPATGPGSVGVKLTSTVWLWPGASWKLVGWTVNTGRSALRLVTSSRSVPTLLTSTLSVRTAPMNSSPKANEESETARSGAPVTCRRAGTRTVDSSGSLLSTTTSAR
jgi:hypothetical protein